MPTRAGRGGVVRAWDATDAIAGAGGFVSFIGFDPDRRIGVVLLANFTSSGRALIQVGYDLLARP
jgi:hypothetical protein